MQIISSKNFEKKLSKLSKSVKIKLKEKLRIFMENPSNILLNNHKLHGKYKNYRSINITGDYRIIFEELENNCILLVNINTHSELYVKAKTHNPHTF